MGTFLRILAWIGAILFALTALVELTTGRPLVSLVQLLVAAWMFPPLWAHLATQNFSLPLWGRWLGGVGTLLVGGGIAGALSPSPPRPVNAVAAPAAVPAAQPARKSRPEPIAAPTPPPRPIEPPEPSKWNISSVTSPLDDSTNVYASIQSNERVRGWIGSHRPVMTARCKEGETDVYVNIGTQIHTFDFDYGRQLTQVRYRIGDAPPRTAMLPESTEGEAFFFSSSVPMLKQMKSADRFVIEYTPFQAGLGTATFDIQGIEEVVNKIAKACNWR